MPAITQSPLALHTSPPLLDLPPHVEPHIGGDCLQPQTRELHAGGRQELEGALVQAVRDGDGQAGSASG